MIRLPVFYLTHGAGPCFWVTLPPPFGPRAYDRLRAYFEGLLASLPERPRAILMVTAHWEEPLPTVSSAAAPPMLYDYAGFPSIAYQLQHAAPGDPQLAARVGELLEKRGVPHAMNDVRGFDHGVFVPMKIIDPDAGIPIVMMSLHDTLDAATHLAIGETISSLREEGVLIVGSGSSYHNLRGIFQGDGRASIAFDSWLHEAIASDRPLRSSRLVDWMEAPGGRDSHPRPDHLMPLMVAAGAAGADLGQRTFTEVIGGRAYSCFAFGQAARSRHR
jgi:aromatic ring-opening dioxygenase catalytic subunit (LigB family)